MGSKKSTYCARRELEETQCTSEHRANSIAEDIGSLGDLFCVQILLERMHTVRSVLNHLVIKDVHGKFKGAGADASPR